MKRSKEFYGLIGFTILISIVLIGASVFGQIIIPGILYPVYVKHNNTHVDFLMTVKSTDLHDNFTKIRGEDYFITNSTEFLEMQVNKTYSCNKTSNLFSYNNMLSNCKEININLIKEK